MTGRIAAALLALSTTLLTGAWIFQERASADLSRARVLQAREPGGGGGEPPSPEDNRAVIASLEEATRIRRAIEGDLVLIERAIESLSERQIDAERTTSAARRELDGLGRALSGSVDASQMSAARLYALRERLRRSAALTGLIAEELEELDRKMGPRAGRP